MPAPQIIINLVNEFKENEAMYKDETIFDEENTKVKFLNPFLEALGWNVRNVGLAPWEREVIFEGSVKDGKTTIKPDYEFLVDGETKFYLEAKKPSRDIVKDKTHAYQVRIYGWNAKIPLSILSDFEEFAIYDTRIKPEMNQSATIGRVAYYHYTDYIEKWDEIYNIFSKEAVISGKFDEFAGTIKTPGKGETEVDDEFLKDIEEWRLMLARNIALRNSELSIEELNYAVQLIIDRIIFLRIAEDRKFERYKQLLDLLKKPNVYKNFTKICKDADDKYNSGLFHFKGDDNDITLDTFTLDLNIDDEIFKKIFKKLYYPNSPYRFDIISTEILGKIYEQFLGKIIRLTDGHHAKIDDKPEVAKAGGVYYTPQYIVDYIVKNTIGKKIEGKTPNQISKFKIVDPACGSGSFLIRAYDYLLKYHLKYYLKLDKRPKNVIYQLKDGSYRLTITEKKRILKNNIYGVDIDTLAVEVTKLSLLLKVLEDQNKEKVEQQKTLFHKRALPNLSNNIKNGNSIVNSEILIQEKLSLDEIKKIKPFDWEQEFPHIFNNTNEKDNGFDIVIGNPPYISAKVHAKFNPIERKFVKEHFRFTGSWDIFITFLNQAINIINSNGYYGWIVPNKLLISEYAKSTLEKLTQTGLNYIVDVSKFNVFENASVYPILVIGNEYKKPTSFKKFKINEIKDLKNNNLIEEKELKRNETTIKDLNIKIGSGATGYQAQEIKKQVHNFNEKKEGDIPFAVSGSIDPYEIDISTVRYMKNAYSNPVISKNKNIADSKWNFWCNEKIIIAGMTKRLEAVYIKEPLAIGVGTYAIYDFGDLNPYYILGCLNSKYFTYKFKKMFKDKHLQGGYLAINKGNLLELPMKIPDEVSNELIIESVKEIMEYYQEYNNSNTPSEKRVIQNQIELLNKKINEIIYKLYELTDDEIKIVENMY